MIVKAITVNGQKYGLTGLMTFDEVGEANDIFNPESVVIDSPTKESQNARRDRAISNRKAVKAQIDFMAKMFERYVQMSPAQRKKLGFREALAVFQALQTASTEVPENLEQPSESESSSALILSKT